MAISSFQKFLKDIKILVVDDVSSMRVVIKSIIKEYCQEVRGANNGLDALEKIREFQPDLIITDINMPEMDGLTLTEKIKRVNPEQPIIVVSSHDDREQLFRAINLGVDGFLSKPVEKAQLIESVEKSLFGKYQLFLKNQETKDFISQNLLKAKSELLQDLSFHWTNPLNVISLALQDIAMEIEEDSIDKKSILEDLDHANALIRNLSKTILNFNSCFDNSNEKIETDINQVVKSLIFTFSEKIKNEKVKVSFEDVIHLDLKTNKNALSIAIYNLIENAYHSLKDLEKDEKLEITIKLFKENEINFLSVSDNGKTSNKNLKKLFSNIHLKDLNPKKDMGLYISKTILESYGIGKLSIENSTEYSNNLVIEFN